VRLATVAPRLLCDRSAVKLRLLWLLLAPVVLLQAQECRQRLAEDFVPMTTSERLVSAADSVLGPRAFLEVGLRAAIDQGTNRQREWGQGAEGFGLRLGSAWAERFIGQVVEQTAAFKLHEDNRYFVSGSGGVARRFGYAAASTLLARHDDGSRGFAYSVVAGAAAGAFAARAWQPRSNTSAGDAAISFALTLGLRAGLNVLREFSPAFLRPVLR
jgi:hypothetical protein